MHRSGLPEALWSDLNDAQRTALLAVAEDARLV